MGGALFRTCGAQDNNIVSHKTYVNVDSPILSSTTPLKLKTVSDSRRHSILKSSFSSPSKLSLSQSASKHDPDLDPLVNKTTKHDRHLAAISAIEKSTEKISFNDNINDEVLSSSSSPIKQPILRKGRTLSILSSSATKETLKDISPLLNQSTIVELNPGNGSNHPISQPIQIVAINPNFTGPPDLSSNSSSGGGTKIRLVNLTDTEDTLTEDGYIYYGTITDKHNNYRASISLTNSHTFSVNSFKLSSSINNRQSVGSIKRGLSPNPDVAGMSMFVNNNETPDEEDLEFSSPSTTSTISDTDNVENDICNFVPSSSSNSTTPSAASDTPLFDPQSSQELPIIFNRQSIEKITQKSENVRSSSTGKRLPLSKRYGTVSDLNQAIMEEEQHIRSISVTHSLSLKSKLNKLQKEVQTVSLLNHSMTDDSSLKSLISSNITSKRTTTPNKNKRRKAMTPNPESNRVPMIDEKPMVMSMSLTNLFSKTTNVSSPETSPIPSISNPRDSFKKRSMFYNSTQNFWNENHPKINNLEEPLLKKSFEQFNTNLRSSVTLTTSSPTRPILPSIGKKKETPLIIDTSTNRITTPSPTQLNIFKSFSKDTEKSIDGNSEVKIVIEEPKESPSYLTDRKAPLTLKQLKKQRLQQLKEKKENEERLMESLMDEQSEINNYLKAIYNHEYYDIS